mgnify:CR=1 FL=1
MCLIKGNTGMRKNWQVSVSKNRCAFSLTVFLIKGNYFFIMHGNIAVWYFRNNDKSTFRSACHAWQAGVQRSLWFRLAHVWPWKHHRAKHKLTNGDVPSKNIQIQEVFQVTGTNRVSCAATAQIRKGLQFQGASTSEKSLVPRSFEKLRERKEACR